jgi:hypothetical protein
VEHPYRTADGLIIPPGALICEVRGARDYASMHRALAMAVLVISAVCVAGYLYGGSDRLLVIITTAGFFAFGGILQSLLLGTLLHLPTHVARWTVLGCLIGLWSTWTITLIGITAIIPAAYVVALLTGSSPLTMELLIDEMNHDLATLQSRMAAGTATQHDRQMAVHVEKLLEEATSMAAPVAPHTT